MDDEAPDPDLEHARLIAYHVKPVIEQLNRIEAALDGIAASLAADADDAVT